MKLVLHIVDFVAKIEEVPDDYIQCSVTAEYRPASEFGENGSQTRTNCTRAYNLPYKDMMKLEDDVNSVLKTPQYKEVLREFNEICKMNHIRYAGVKVADMISWLQELPKDAKLIMTQDGYYADGILGDIFPPEKYKNQDDIYVIGHSSQNY